MDIRALNEFTGIIRKAVDDYGMINEGDRVAVGVSGGKDSMLLLLALKHLQSYYPKHFELEAITIELGFESMDFTPVREMCKELDIPYTCLKTEASKGPVTTNIPLIGNVTLNETDVDKLYTLIKQS